VRYRNRRARLRSGRPGASAAAVGVGAAEAAPAWGGAAALGAFHWLGRKEQ